MCTMENSRKSIYGFKVIIYFFLLFCSFSFSMELNNKSEKAMQAKTDLFDLLPDEIVLMIIQYSGANINFNKEDSHRSFRSVVNKLLSRGQKSGYNLTSTCKRINTFKIFVNERIKKLLLEKYENQNLLKNYLKLIGPS